ncbi:hypothetical protein D3C86_1251580 [compost metagenome]
MCSGNARQLQRLEGRRRHPEHVVDLLDDAVDALHQACAGSFVSLGNTIPAADEVATQVMYRGAFDATLHVVPGHPGLLGRVDHLGRRQRLAKFAQIGVRLLAVGGTRSQQAQKRKGQRLEGFSRLFQQLGRKPAHVDVVQPRDHDGRTVDCIGGPAFVQSIELVLQGFVEAAVGPARDALGSIERDILQLPHELRHQVDGTPPVGELLVRVFHFVAHGTDRVLCNGHRLDGGRCDELRRLCDLAFEAGGDQFCTRQVLDFLNVADFVDGRYAGVVKLLVRAATGLELEGAIVVATIGQVHAAHEGILVVDDHEFLVVRKTDVECAGHVALCNGREAMRTMRPCATRVQVMEHQHGLEVASVDTDLR